jgi:hypothetical protein
MLKKTYLRIEPKDDRIEVELHHLPSKGDGIYYKEKRYLVVFKTFDFDDNAIDIFCSLDD